MLSETPLSSTVLVYFSLIGFNDAEHCFIVYAKCGFENFNYYKVKLGPDKQ